MAPAYAASVNLRWDTSSDSRVTGYRLYYGPRARTYTNSVDAGNANSRLVGGLGAGATYFFAVTSYNRLGIESPPSNEISYAPTNLPPSISTVSNQSVALDQATAAIPFVVGDADTPAANLTISGVAANPALVSLITLGGSGSNRTVKVSPVAGKSGTTTITVSVSDGTLSASSSFGFTVADPAQGLPSSTTIVGLLAYPAGKIVTWGSVSGSVYRVAYKTNLIQTNWSDLSAEVIARGTRTSWLDTDFNPASRFYRVRFVR